MRCLMAVRIIILSRLLRGVSALPTLCARVHCSSTVNSNSIVVVRFIRGDLYSVVYYVLIPNVYEESQKLSEISPSCGRRNDRSV